MYLSNTDQYFFIKTRNNNNIINTICKTLKIEYKVFFDRILKIRD